MMLERQYKHAQALWPGFLDLFDNETVTLESMDTFMHASLSLFNNLEEIVNAAVAQVDYITTLAKPQNVTTGELLWLCAQTGTLHQLAAQYQGGCIVCNDMANRADDKLQAHLEQVRDMGYHLTDALLVIKSVVEEFVTLYTLPENERKRLRV